MSRLLAKRLATLRQMACSPQSRAPAEHYPFTTSTIQCDPISIPSESPSSRDGSSPKILFRYTAGGLTAARRKPNRRPRSSNKNTSKALEANGDGTASGESSAANDNIIAMLATPTWSVRSLLPPKSPTQTITRTELHHLLRLSALPLPKDQVEEKKLLKSLHAQLHFVGDIQSVNTEGVEPLVRIAEETEEARRDATIGLDDLKHVLDKEVVVGRNKRRRRVRDEGNVGEGEDWDVFKTASETVEVPGSGRYFVVRSGKEKEDES